MRFLLGILSGAYLAWTMFGFKAMSRLAEGGGAMSLSIEHLEIAESALDALMGISSDSKPEEGFGDCIRALRAELHRRKHGPFTLAEAVASGKPFKRPGWNDYATVLVDSDDDGYMCFVFVAAGPEPAYAEELLATDYELAEGGG